MGNLQKLNALICDEKAIGTKHKERWDRVDGVRLSV
jgi:hypothetical protein